MAVAYVQQLGVDASYGSIGGSTYTLTASGTATAGNAVVFSIFWKEVTGLVTITSVVDNNGGTYVDCGAGKTARPGTGFVQLFGAKNVSGGSRTITVTFSGGGANTIATLASEYSGCSTTTLFDSVSASNTATTGSTISATVTPTGTSGALLTYAVNNVGGSATIDSSFTERYDDSGGGWENADKVFTSSPGSVSPTVTFSSSFTAGVLLLAVLNAAGAGPLTSAASESVTASDALGSSGAFSVAAAETATLTDSFSFIGPATAIRHSRHHPIIWRRTFAASSLASGISESPTLADSVNAIYVGSVATAEALTLSETEFYPSTSLGQSYYRGRNPPIVWRQTEAALIIPPLIGNFSDALTLLDSLASTQAFAVTSLETVGVSDANASGGGTTTGDVSESGTISDASSAVFAYSDGVSEGLNAVDAMDGQGGSPVIPPSHGGGGGHVHKPHKPPKSRAQRIKEAQEDEPKKVVAKVKKTKKKAEPTEDEKELAFILQIIKDML